MKQNNPSLILQVTYRLVAPVLLMFGIYVLVHGEYSPGGGFQAGVILALAIILQRLLSPQRLGSSLWGYKAIVVAGLGALIYGLVGVITMAAGGKMLEYGFLPLPGLDVVGRHLNGILFIEIGVTIGVMATVVSIFDSLGRVEDPHDYNSLL